MMNIHQMIQLVVHVIDKCIVQFSLDADLLKGHYFQI